MKKVGFFEENEGEYSMTRLITFFAGIAGFFLSTAGVMWQVVQTGEVGFDFVTFALSVWVIAFGGKNSAKWIEKMQASRERTATKTQ